MLTETIKYPLVEQEYNPELSPHQERQARKIARRIANRVAHDRYVLKAPPKVPFLSKVSQNRQYSLATYTRAEAILQGTGRPTTFVVWKDHRERYPDMISATWAHGERLPWSNYNGGPNSMEELMQRLAETQRAEGLSPTE
jgi:hypothetical protein